ncbi:cyclic GMP-AMP synthase isoform X1 [Leopardus geoffroyi]|uniref:cyclic GMP-AMP synthase isoform X1 n=1 Tax=Leopardus geoffroyi TaxID=46844 RepID=UPI001E260549|nr:cyclic GMP-AMP synthase isoform X1 [Leopardus geoffroyi]
MDHRGGKATRTASKAATATSKISAQGVKGLREEPIESPSAPGATRPNSRKCGAVGASGSLQRRSTPGSPERPQVRARGARAKKALLDAEDAVEGQAVPAAKLEPPAAGPPLSRASSRRRGSARAAGEQRPPPEPTEFPSPGPLVSASGAAPGGWNPRAVLDKLRLRRQEISLAAETVNKVVDHLLRGLKSCDSEFKDVGLLRTGSYYEHVKISAPNEFDIMFKLEVSRIQLEEYRNSGAYYFVKFKRNPKGNPLSPFLEGEILSASKMLWKFRKIIKKEIENIEDVIVQRKKRGSPAVTLLIRKPKEISVDITLALELNTSWPASTKNGLPVKDWLGTKVRSSLRQQPFYLVPKHAKEGNGFQEETWRLSFSHIEKDILKSHGQSKTCCEINGMKCCRKDCLKLMKYLLEQLKIKFEDRKELDKFSSYHVKTAFFHVCTQESQDSHWHTRDLELCFDNCVAYFLQCLKIEHLEHYFIPGFNLFSRDQIDKISKEFLSQEIEYERNNGFPVFHKL